MAGKVRILVEDNGYIDYLGQFGPIASPMKVPFKSALYIAKEGHDVEILTSANQRVSLDPNRIKKMIARDEKIEAIWNEVVEEVEAKEAADEEDETVSEPEPTVDDEDLETPASEQEEVDTDVATTYESDSDIDGDDDLTEEEKEEFKKLLEEEEGDGPVIRG